ALPPMDNNLTDNHRTPPAPTMDPGTPSGVRAGCGACRALGRTAAPMRSAPGLVVMAQSRLVALLVNELTNAGFASLVVEEVGGLLRADQVVLGVVVSHLSNTTYRILGRLQSNRILLQ